MEDEEYQEQSLSSKILPALIFIILTAILIASLYYLFFR